MSGHIQTSNLIISLVFTFHSHPLPEFLLQSALSVLQLQLSGTWGQKQRLDKLSLSHWSITAFNIYIGGLCLHLSVQPFVSMTGCSEKAEIYLKLSNEISLSYLISCHELIKGASLNGLQTWPHIISSCSEMTTTLQGVTTFLNLWYNVSTHHKTSK